MFDFGCWLLAFLGTPSQPFTKSFHLNLAAAPNRFADRFAELIGLRIGQLSVNVLSVNLGAAYFGGQTTPISLQQ